MVLLFLLVSEAPGPEIQILREISSPEPPQNHPGTVRTKTHSGGSDGTGGFGGFLGSARFLTLKFGFYEKFHRQNWLEIVGKQKYDPKKRIHGVVVVLVVPRVGSGTGGPGGD